MLNFTLTQADMDYLTKGELHYLDTKDFDAWEAKTGAQMVVLNGEMARVVVNAEEPNCSCCRGCMPVYEWSLKLL